MSVTKSGKRAIGAGMRGVLPLLLALLVVGLAGCRRPEPPARGWVQLAALRPLHPNQAMLADIDHRLDALAAQRARLLAQPDAPLPPAYIPLDMPAADPLPAPTPVSAPPRPVVAAEPRLAELRDRLTEEMTRQYDRLRQQAETERSAAYQTKERALQADADEQRKAAAAPFNLRIPTAKVRLRLADEQAARAKDDAGAAQVQADRAREHADAVIRTYTKAPEKHHQEISKAEEDAKYYLTRADRLREYAAAQQEAAQAVAAQLDADTRALAAAQAQIEVELQQRLAAVDREQTQAMRDRLAEWRRQAEDAITSRLAERAARLTDENTRPGAAPPSPIDFPALPLRPMTTRSGPLRVAVNTTNFHALQRRLDDARAIDVTVNKLSAERKQLLQSIDRDTRAAALAVAAQHNYTLTFDHPAGRNLTPTLRRWLADYWPPDNN